MGRTLGANRLLAGSACGKRQRWRPLNSVVRPQRMDTSKPIQTIARPKSSAFAVTFARELLPLFEHHERLDAEPVSGGLLIAGVWEPDLDVAHQMIAAAYSGEVAWDAPRINYIEDTWRQEPVLLVEVRTPDDYLGNVIGDLSSRRAMITEHRALPNGSVVYAHAPLAELSGYLSTLARITGGSAQAIAKFHSYQTAPRNPGPPDEPMSAALRA